MALGRGEISLAGVTSHLSAARHWGWPVKWPPDRPWVTVRRKRHLDAETRAVVNVSYADLTPDEIVDGVTSPLRTVLDCARRLPFDEATAKAANPFESVLRALVLEFPRLTVSPQLPITARGRTWHPDLVDSTRRLVLEADSWPVVGAAA